MTERIIPIADARYNAGTPRVPASPAPPTGRLADARARTLRDLRISVTDRCNFRCSYCMPPAVFDRNFQFLPHSSLLTFEEIERMARIFAAHGVEKIRITGGEPLLRRNIEVLIGMLAQIRTVHDRPVEITLTTNASLLARKAGALAAAGLRRVTVSLDALDDAVFRALNSADFPVADVLAGIDAAAAAGLRSIKVNMVVKRGVNDHEIVPMARYFRGSGHIVRFIEFMDVGASNDWRLDDVVPSTEVLARINEQFPLEPVAAQYPGEVARRWRYADGSGEIGVISSVSQPFCSSCNRARLSTEGKLFTCLFATAGHDLRALLRGGFRDEQISGAISALWSQRSDRYSEIRSEATSGLRRIEMSYIGG